MSVGLISHAILKLSRYLCARASNITLLVSLFYMWRVYQAAALVYESVSKEKSPGADPGGRGDWVAGPLGQLTLKEIDTRKNNPKYVGPKKYRIKGNTCNRHARKCRTIDRSVVCEKVVALHGCTLDE